LANLVLAMVRQLVLELANQLVSALELVQELAIVLSELELELELANHLVLAMVRQLVPETANHQVLAMAHKLVGPDSANRLVQLELAKHRQLPRSRPVHTLRDHCMQCHLAWHSFQVGIDLDSCVG